MKLSYLLLLFFAILTTGAYAKQLNNLDSSGLALQGYDPVAFFTDHKPVNGNTLVSVRL